MNEITNNDVLDFIRILTNFGDAFHLNEEDMTISKQDGNQVCVQDGDQVKPVQFLFNGMVRDETKAALNPFKMVEGVNPAQTWFYQSRYTVLGVLTKKLIVKIAELGYTKETEDYDCLELLSKVSEQCDKTLVDELSKINASDYLRIFYNKKNKTAEAQTAIFTDDLESKHKFRKKTWHVLSDLFRGIFKLEPTDCTMSKYSYRATNLSIPEIDSKLHVMGALITAIDPLCKALLKTDLQSAEFNKHLGNLDTYARMYAWFTAKVSNSDKAVSTLSNGAAGVAPAWTTSPQGVAVPVADPSKISNPMALAPITPSAPMMPQVAPVQPITPMMPQVAPTMPVAPQQYQLIQPQPMMPSFMPVQPMVNPSQYVPV